jgi:hypothetical protein
VSSMFDVFGNLVHDDSSPVGFKGGRTQVSCPAAAREERTKPRNTRKRRKKGGQGSTL